MHTYFVLYQGFLSQAPVIQRTARQGRDHLLFHSTTSNPSRIVRHSLATLHVRWLSRILNRITCIYQTATRWNVPPYWTTIWLIDDVMLLFVYLMIWFYVLLQQFETGNRCIWTRIDYNPCIASKPTNQVD